VSLLIGSKKSGRINVQIIHYNIMCKLSDESASKTTADDNHIFGVDR